MTTVGGVVLWMGRRARRKPSLLVGALKGRAKFTIRGALDEVDFTEAPHFR